MGLARLCLAGSIILIEPKCFGSGYKPEPAKDDKFKCFLHCKFRFHFKGLFKFIYWWALPTITNRLSPIVVGNAHPTLDVIGSSC
jgi:hypothetical protein